MPMIFANIKIDVGSASTSPKSKAFEKAIALYQSTHTQQSRSSTKVFQAPKSFDSITHALIAGGSVSCLAFIVVVFCFTRRNSSNIPKKSRSLRYNPSETSSSINSEERDNSSQSGMTESELNSIVSSVMTVSSLILYYTNSADPCL